MLIACACAGRKIYSNVLFQQLLYYQFFFDIAWISFWAAWLLSRNAVCSANSNAAEVRLLGEFAGLNTHCPAAATLLRALHARTLMHAPRSCIHALHAYPCTQYWKGLKYMDQDSVRTVMIVFWLLCEPVRLRAGWYGNLQENVSAPYS